MSTDPDITTRINALETARIDDRITSTETTLFDTITEVRTLATTMTTLTQQLGELQTRYDYLLERLVDARLLADIAAEDVAELGHRLPPAAYAVRCRSAREDGRMVQTLSSGTGFMHDCDHQIELSPHVGIRITLDPDARRLITPEPGAIQAHTATIDGRRIHILRITQLVQMSERMEHYYFTVPAPSGESVDHVLSLSYTYQADVSSDIVRLSWSLGRFVGDTEEDAQ